MLLVNPSRVQTAPNSLGQGITAFRRCVTVIAVYLAHVCAVIDTGFCYRMCCRFIVLSKYESDGVTLGVSDICTIRLPSQQMFGGCILGSVYIELSGR